MKIIKLTLLIALLSITICRKDQSKNKNKGEACEVGVFEVKITVDEEVSDAKLDARLLKDPKGDILKGLIFTGTPGSLLTKCTIKNDQGFYIPFRQLVEAFSSQNNPSAGKKLVSIIEINSASTPEFHTITIQFNFDPNWDVISETEFSDILRILNDLRSTRRTYIEALKIQANDYASSFALKSGLAEEAGGDEQKLKEKLTEFSNKINELKETNKKLNEKIKSNQSDIGAKKSQAEAAQGRVSSSSGKLNVLTGDLSGQKSTKINYENAKKDNVNLMTEYNNYITRYLQLILDLNNIYREESAFNSGKLDTAYNTFKSDFNKDTFSTNLINAFDKK